MSLENRTGLILNSREEAALQQVLGQRHIDPNTTRVEIHLSNDEHSPLHQSGGCGWSSDEGSYEIIYLEDLHRVAAEAASRAPGSLDVMFYPDATVSEENLKVALIYFDRVFVLFPDEAFIPFAIRGRGRPDSETTELLRIRHMQGSHLDEGRSTRQTVYEIWRRQREFYNRTLDLRRAGVLNFLSPASNLNPFFAAAVSSDLQDKEFCENACASFGSAVYIAGSKGLYLRRHHGKPLTRHFQTAEELLSWTNRNSGHISHPYGYIEVPAPVAVSTLLNHTLRHCSRLGLSPVTQKSAYQNFLFTKLSRQQSKEALAHYADRQGIAASSLALRTLKNHVPNIEAASYDDILEFRDKLRDDLAEFRGAMRSLSWAIDLNDRLDRLDQQIQKVVEADVEPRIAALKKKLATSKDRFVHRLVRNVKTGTVPLVATLWAGLPVPYLLAISAGVVTLEALLETKIDIDQAKNDVNGLSFLLECEKKI